MDTWEIYYEILMVPNRLDNFTFNLRHRGSAGGALAPDVWFRSVEWVVARRISCETVHYVANVYKIHVAFEMLLGQQ